MTNRCISPLMKLELWLVGGLIIYFYSVFKSEHQLMVFSAATRWNSPEPGTCLRDQIDAVVRCLAGPLSPQKSEEPFRSGPTVPPIRRQSSRTPRAPVLMSLRSTEGGMTTNRTEPSSPRDVPTSAVRAAHAHFLLGLFTIKDIVADVTR